MIISSIAVWELGLKTGLGKLQIPLSIGHYAARRQRLERLEIRNMDVATWLANLALEWGHRYPADRTIIATAPMLDCLLESSDKKLPRSTGRPSGIKPTLLAITAFLVTLDPARQTLPLTPSSPSQVLTA